MAVAGAESLAVKEGGIPSKDAIQGIHAKADVRPI
jgi:hypothetical protein